MTGFFPTRRRRTCLSAALSVIEETIERIKTAKADDRPVMLACGAHTIKNGMAPVLIALMEQGIITHLAMNGGGHHT